MPSALGCATAAGYHCIRPGGGGGKPGDQRSSGQVKGGGGHLESQTTGTHFGSVSTCDYVHIY